MGELGGSLEGALRGGFDAGRDMVEVRGREEQVATLLLVKPREEEKFTVLSLDDGRELVWAGEVGGAERWWDRDNRRYADSEGNPDIPEIDGGGEAPDATERFLFYGRLDGVEVYLRQKGGGLYVTDEGALRRIDGDDGVIEVNRG